MRNDPDMSLVRKKVFLHALELKFDTLVDE